MPSNDDIHTNALLRKANASTWDLIVRWHLGIQNSDRLPHPGDVFTVSAETFDEQIEVVPPTDIEPANFAMLIPPRKESTIAGLSASQPLPYPTWKAGARPTKPIDPALPSGSDLPDDEGLGVYHLLAEAQRSRAEWRIARALKTSVEPIITDQISSASAPVSSLKDICGSDDENVKTFVILSMARLMARRGIRVRNMAQLIEETRQGLVRRRNDSTEPIPLMFKLDSDLFASFSSGDELKAQWEYLLLVTRICEDAVLLSEIHKIANTRSQISALIRMRGLHGGSLVDFWCNRYSSQPACGLLTRGLQYPGSELLGLGCTFGGFTSNDLMLWDTHGGLKIHVEHAPYFTSSRGASYSRLNPESPPNVDLTTSLGDILHSVEDSAVGPNDAYILTSENAIQSALNNGSSCPIVPNKLECRVNYDLKHMDYGPSVLPSQLDQSALGYATGDGRVEITIDFVAGAKSTVGAFNVYCMWQTQPNDPLFTNPTATTPLSTIKKWLITKRYSYSRELQGYNGVLDVQRIVDAIDQPPWEPIFPRPNTSSSDEKTNTSALMTDRGEDLPDPMYPGKSLWSTDLRLGMRVQAQNPVTFIGWDTQAAPDVDWTPDKTRSGAPAGQAPQAYRLWVTAVDYFDQESDPIAILTNDSDAGESTRSYIFKPRRRFRLSPPLDQKSDGTSGRWLTLIPASGANPAKIRIHWLTPTYSQISQQSMQQAPTALNPQSLTAALRLYRRRLTAAVEITAEPSWYLGDEFSEDPFSSEDWVKSDQQLQSEGWERLTTNNWDAIVFPGGPEWYVDYPVDHLDRGFEYVAAISMSIKKGDPEENFWMPNLIGKSRTAQWVVKTSTGHQAQRIALEETPRTSQVVRTGTLPIPNPEEPRGVTWVLPLSGPSLAKPVLPVAGVDRDLVLNYVVNRSFIDDQGTPVDPKPWPPGAESDDQQLLTVGQRAMCEAALDRTPIFANLSDLDKTNSRVILANDFRHVSTADDPRHGTTIGFRGLMPLTWTYSLNNLNTNEAEPTQYRLYSAKAPLNAELAAHSAAFSSSALNSPVGTWTYKLDFGSTTPNQWPQDFWAIVDHQRGSLVRIEDPSLQSAVFARVIKASTDTTQAPPTNSIELEILGNFVPPAPANPTLRFYPSKLVFQRTYLPPEPSNRSNLNVPISGGVAEVIGWWLVTVSAQGREAGHARQAFHWKDFTQSIAPPTPSDLIVIPPCFDDHHLAYPTHKDWLPTDITNQSGCTASPRLIITWKPVGDASDEFKIAIERHVTSIDSTPRTLLSRSSTWAAIKEIATTPKELGIRVECVHQIQPTWLAGDVIAPDEDAGTPSYWIEPSRKLSAVSGVKTMPIPGLKPNDPPLIRPALVDYFQSNGDPGAIMDGGFQYSYRLTSCLEIAPCQYLFSGPTAWSPNQIPRTLPITVSVLAEADNEINDVGPRVRITAYGPSSRQNGAYFNRAIEWKYRVLVRREQTFTLPATTGTQEFPAWHDVGIIPALGPDEQGEVIDLDVERPDDASPCNLLYRIFVNQHVIMDNGVEHVVRGAVAPYYEVLITIPVSTNSNEREATIAVKIDW